MQGSAEFEQQLRDAAEKGIENLEQEQQDHLARCKAEIAEKQVAARAANQQCKNEQISYQDKLAALYKAQIRALYARFDTGKKWPPSTVDALLKENAHQLRRMLASVRHMFADELREEARVARRDLAAALARRVAAGAEVAVPATTAGEMPSFVAEFKDGPLGMKLYATEGFVYVLDIAAGGQAEDAGATGTENTALKPGSVITHIGGEEISPDRLPDLTTELVTTMINEAGRPLEIGFRQRTLEETTPLDTIMKDNRLAFMQRTRARRAASRPDEAAAEVTVRFDEGGERQEWEAAAEGGGVPKKYKHKKKKSKHKKKISRKKRSKKKISKKKRSKKRTRRR